jgi:hypothetical protein
MGAELSTVVATEAVKSIAGKVFAADQVMKDIGVSTKFIAKAVDTMANLAYQEKFPDHVIHMFEDEVRNTSKCDPAGSHYFAMYHPGSESFAAIQNRLQGRIPGSLLDQTPSCTCYSHPPISTASTKQFMYRQPSCLYVFLVRLTQMATLMYMQNLTSREILNVEDWG